VQAVVEQRHVEMTAAREGLPAVAVEQRQVEEVAAELRDVALDPAQRVAGEVDVVVEQHHPIRLRELHRAIASAGDAVVLAQLDDLATQPALGHDRFELGQFGRHRALVDDQHRAGEVRDHPLDRLDQPHRQRGAVHRQQRDRQVGAGDADVGAIVPMHVRGQQFVQPLEHVARHGQAGHRVRVELVRSLRIAHQGSRSRAPRRARQPSRTTAPRASEQSAAAARANPTTHRGHWPRPNHGCTPRPSPRHWALAAACCRGALVNPRAARGASRPAAHAAPRAHGDRIRRDGT
jgi:hypothetical protein